MTPERIARMVQVCKDIQTDMADDARHFDGQPFNGKTVATYFGNQGAAIAALAELVAALLEHGDA